MVVVKTFANRFEADLAKSALDAAGIDARIRADDAGGLRPNLWVGGGVDVYVDEDDLSRAAEILDIPARPMPVLHPRRD